MKKKWDKIFKSHPLIKRHELLLTFFYSTSFHWFKPAFGCFTFLFYKLMAVINNCLIHYRIYGSKSEYVLGEAETPSLARQVGAAQPEGGGGVGGGPGTAAEDSKEDHHAMGKVRYRHPS